MSLGEHFDLNIPSVKLSQIKLNKNNFDDKEQTEQEIKNCKKTEASILKRATTKIGS